MLMPQSHKQKKIYIGGYSGQLCEMDFDKKILLRQVKWETGISGQGIFDLGLNFS